ncbi:MULTISPECIES: ABC transporter ATP-binding protein [Rhodococcus]|uniref:sulfate/molybdate ABC transporter ATP-binding protein n=1 Tax=Rhodococcus TaxID=1827 RepID=UPI00163A1979|nr:MULTISPECIES: ABC transporter ATP-binding protein [Rhodococcus]MBC2590237.1 ABC transporter ATP-binding protein [Rhodococcus aetherivorans]QRI76842.1 ABC transporter ATP-binding protein [Rhodococcus aetherivorans]QSE60259.1 ABC transporter ATP-binding protein [Rhodococcus sp. PSBB066]QSE68435.1 ABC transporter ATP-binding protein [Rhodococcus sp. PSBB049]
MTGLRLRARVGSRDVDLAVAVESGRVLAVLGPNGAGKSTLLNVIAGLLQPDDGRIELDGCVLTDTAAGVAVPPHRRGVALLAQQPLLFPHLSVLDNVAFAPHSAGRGRSAARAAALRQLAAVDATELADRRPHQLSGGQAQRVAIGRALAADPRLLLLDEPMAALDVTAAPAVRSLLRTVLRGPGRTALVVTHDPLDALALADRAVVLDDGRIVEEGTVRDVLSRPRSAFAARIAGLNLLAGTVTADGLDTPVGRVRGVLDDDCAPGNSAVSVFTPAAVAVYPGEPHGSPRNSFAVVVGELEVHGATVLVRAAESGITAEVTTSAAADLALAPGATMWFVVKATEVRIHAAR